MKSRKNIIKRLLSIALVVCMIPALGSCSPADAANGIRTNISNSINRLKSLPKNPDFNNTIKGGRA